jgi:hypothetical protein
MTTENQTAADSPVSACSRPSRQQVRDEIAKLREIVDTSDDVAAKRIAYTLETALRWVIEETCGWESPSESLPSDVKMLRDELS